MNGCLIRHLPVNLRVSLNRWVLSWIIIRFQIILVLNFEYVVGKIILLIGLFRIIFYINCILRFNIYKGILPRSLNSWEGRIIRHCSKRFWIGSNKLYLMMVHFNVYNFLSFFHNLICLIYILGVLWRIELRQLLNWLTCEFYDLFLVRRRLKHGVLGAKWAMS